MGSRGRGQPFNQVNRQRQYQDQQLFEQEYDFEQANEEFEELRNQLSKTKIVENGDKKDDSATTKLPQGMNPARSIQHFKTKANLSLTVSPVRLLREVKGE